MIHGNLGGQGSPALGKVVVLYSSAPQTWLALLDTDSLAALEHEAALHGFLTDQWPCQRQQLMTGRLPADDLIMDSHWAP